MMLPPELMGMFNQFLGGFMSQESQQVTNQYNRTAGRAVNPAADYMRIHEMTRKRVELRENNKRLANVRAYMQRMQDRGIGNVRDDQIANVSGQLSRISRDMGRSTPISWAKRNQQGGLESINFDEIDAELRSSAYQNREIGQNLDKRYSPEQRMRSGYSYMMMSDENIRNRVRGTGTRELLQDLMAEKGGKESLDAAIKEMGRKVSVKQKATGKALGKDDAEIYEDFASNLLEGEQALFRQKVEEVSNKKAQELANKYAQNVEAGYENTRKTVERWKTGSDEEYFSDIRKLREAGYIGDDKLNEITANRVTGTEAEELAGQLSDLNNNVPHPEVTTDRDGNIVALGAAGAAGKAAMSPQAAAAGVPQGGVAGKLGNLVGRFGGPAALGATVLGSLGELSVVGGNTGASSMINAGTSIAPGALATLGAIFGGGPIGGAIGYGAGVALDKTVGAVARPYLGFVQEQKQYEAITGENLQGAGADQSGLMDFASIAIPGIGGNTIQEAQNRARLQNPFLDPSQIEALTTAMLELGNSTEETAARIEPLASVIGDFNIDPQLVAMFDRMGQAESGGLSGPALARMYAEQIQGAAGEGFTQQDIQGYVQNAMGQFGNSSGGFETAPMLATALAETLSAGSPEADLVFQNNGTVDTINANAANNQDDFYAMMRAGVDPSSPYNSAENTQKMQASSIEDAKRLYNMMPKAANGELSEAGAAFMQSQLDSGLFPALNGMGVDEVVALAKNENINGESLGKNFEKRQREKKEREQLLSDRAGGKRNEGWEKIENAGGRVSPFAPWGAFTPDQATASANYKLYQQSDKAVKGEGIGAVGALANFNRKTDIQDIELADGSGRTIGDAMDDPKLLKALNAGDRKIKVGDKTMTIEAFGKLQRQGEAVIKDGKASLTDTGKESVGGDKIGLTDEAREFFQIVDVRNVHSAAGKVTRSQDRYDNNKGNKAMNETSKTY